MSAEPTPITLGRMTPEHLAHLRTSGLSDETIALAGLYSLRSPGAVAEALGYKAWRHGGGAIAFPIVRPGRADPELVRVRPDQPRIRKSKPVKYDQRRGTGVVVFYPPRTRAGRLADNSVCVWTEGEKKALALDQLGYCAIGLTGVHGAHDTDERKRSGRWTLHPWLREDLRVEGREHVIAYDSDAATKRQVMEAARRLAAMLLAAGARAVRFARIADGPNGEKRGIDDLLVGEDEAAVRAVLEAAEPITATDTRPEIVITTREDHVVAAAVRALGGDEEVYQRGGQLVRVLSAATAGESTLDPGAPVIAPLPLAVLRTRLAAAAGWLSLDGEPKAVHPPRWAVEAVHALGEWTGIRPLSGVIEAPTLRLDGSVLERPGYDAASGLLYAPQSGVTWPALDRKPTRDRASAALERLEEVVCDFRFAAPHHRSGWLALVLTLVARHAIDGPVPMTLVDAPVAGAGKGLLADVACRISTGRSMPLDGYPRTDEEVDKRVLAWALGARPVVGLDNVSGKLGGDSLCRALTARVVSGRVLGSTAERSAALRTTFVATGNNVELGADMHRRVVHVRLAPIEEDPSVRSGFRHADLVGYVMERRAVLYTAALTVLRAFVAAGRPDQRLEPWGSYEAWSQLVRGALVWAGREDPATGRAELRATADEDRHFHRALVLGWRRLVQIDGGPITAGRAIELVFGERDGVPAEASDLADLFRALAKNRRGEVDARRLGYALRAVRGRVFVDDASAPVMLDSSAKVHGQTRWTVQDPLGPGSDGSGGSDGPCHAHTREKGHACKMAR